MTERSSDLQQLHPSALRTIQSAFIVKSHLPSLLFITGSIAPDNMKEWEVSLFVQMYNQFLVLGNCITNTNCLYWAAWWLSEQNWATSMGSECLVLVWGRKKTDGLGPVTGRFALSCSWSMLDGASDFNFLIMYYTNKSSKEKQRRSEDDQNHCAALKWLG